MKALIARFRWIYLVPVLALVALSAWAFASPIGSSPDDDFHLTSIWCASASPDANCTPGATATSREVPKAMATPPCFWLDATKSAACQAKTGFDTKDTASTIRGNFVGGYPPVFYAFMGIFVGPSIVVSALIMRLVSVILFVALTSVLFVLLPRTRRPALAWSWIITTVPLGLFIIASNNPSSWAITGVGSAWIALLGWFETSGRRKVGLGIVFAIAVVMASGARGDGAIYAALGIVVVLFLTFTRSRRFLVNAILPIALLAVCVYFFISAQQVISGLNGFGGPNSPAAGGTRALGPLLISNLLNIPALWVGIFGSFGLGWLEVGMPQIVIFGALGAFLVVAAVGFGRLTIRKAVSLAAVGLALVVVPVFVLTRGGDLVGEQVQPRYILPMIILLAGLLVLQAGRLPIRFTRGQVILVTLTLTVIQAIALHTTLRRYITGAGKGGWNLDAGIKWWWDSPIAPMAVLIIGSLCYAGAIWILSWEVTRGPSSLEPTDVPSNSV